MNRAGVMLALLLAAQLALLAWLGYDSSRDPDSAIPRLVNTGGYLVDQVRIEDSEGNTAHLQRGPAGWVIPALKGLPADGERLEALLATLTEADAGWAVARSSAARQRFEVAPYRFRRKISLSAQDNALGAVFIGASPGFRKVYARSDGANAIFSVPLNRHELPTADGDWIDPELLQVRAPLRITSDGYSLRRDGELWIRGSGQALPAEQAAALLAALRSLRVEGLAPAGPARKLGPAQAGLIMEIESLGGTASLEFYRDDRGFFLRSSQYPFLFRIPGYLYERISGLDSLILGGAE